MSRGSPYLVALAYLTYPVSPSATPTTCSSGRREGIVPARDTSRGASPVERNTKCSTWNKSREEPQIACLEPGT